MSKADYTYRYSDLKNKSMSFVDAQKIIAYGKHDSDYTSLVWDSITAEAQHFTTPISRIRYYYELINRHILVSNPFTDINRYNLDVTIPIMSSDGIHEIKPFSADSSKKRIQIQLVSTPLDSSYLAGACYSTPLSQHQSGITAACTCTCSSTSQKADLFNGMNDRDFSTSSGGLTVSPEKRATLPINQLLSRFQTHEIIYAEDVITLLTAFMDDLSTIKNFRGNVFFQYTNLIGGIRITTMDFGTESGIRFSVPASEMIGVSNDLRYDVAHIDIMVGPYVAYNVPKNMNKVVEVLLPTGPTSIIGSQVTRTSNKCAFNVLMRVPNDLVSDSPTYDVKSDYGSNGQFRIFKQVKFHTFDLRKHYDIQSLFHLIQGEKIHQNNVLAAIDFIFNQWVQNLQTIQYQYYVCHYNCHANSIGAMSGFIPMKIRLKFQSDKSEITGEGATGLSLDSNTKAYLDSLEYNPDNSLTLDSTQIVVIDSSGASGFDIDQSNVEIVRHDNGEVEIQKDGSVIEKPGKDTRIATGWTIAAGQATTTNSYLFMRLVVSAKTLSITYSYEDEEGSSLSPDDVTNENPTTFKFGTGIPTLVNAEKEGYSFEYWTLDGIEITSVASDIDHDIEIVGHFKKDEEPPEPEDEPV